MHAERRAARPRRDDHRLPLASRRRAGDLRHRARSVDVRQGDGERLRVLGARRASARSWSSAGLRDPRERVFLLSTTHGAETHGLAAAMETMRIYRDEPVIETLHARGRAASPGIEAAAREHGVADRFEVIGRAPNLVYVDTRRRRPPSQAFRTLFLQETIERGFILPSLVVSYSHTEADIDLTIEAVAEALAVYRRALEDGIDGTSPQPARAARSCGPSAEPRPPVRGPIVRGDVRDLRRCRRLGEVDPGTPPRSAPRRIRAGRSSPRASPVERRSANGYGSSCSTGRR